MARMSKAQARKRLAEAGQKVFKVMVAYPEACSPMQMDKMIKELAKITNKLK